MASSQDLAMSIPVVTQHDAAIFHAFDRVPMNERRSITPLSDEALADIRGQGTIDVSILVFSGGILSLDRFMSNPGPPNVGVIQIVPPSPCRDVC
jgi:hypothetical protein